MNNVTPEQKQNVLRTLTFIGLILIIVLVAWLSVQLVKIFPSAVNSLASLADSVYNYNPKTDQTINIERISDPVNAGAEVSIAWGLPTKTGSYAFSYECKDGIKLDLKTTEAEFKDAECGKSYNLGLSDKATLVIHSEKDPETEMTYSVAYFKTNATELFTQGSETIIVKNQDLIAAVVEEPTPAIEEIPKPTSPNKPIVETPTYEYTYTIPTSDPKGFTDLQVTYVGIGETASNGTFINTGILKYDTAGTVQFSVHNIGTKTSAEWTFSAKLPGGVNYESEKQTPLKPNERAVMTISFPAITDTKLQTFTFSSKTELDKNNDNNSVAWSVVVIK